MAGKRRRKGLRTDYEGTRRYASGKGIVEGIKVDKQLNAWVNKKIPITLPRAKRVAKKIQEMGLTPVRAQVYCVNRSDAARSHHTRLDMVCTRPGQEHFILEVKSSRCYSYHFETHWFDLPPGKGDGKELFSHQAQKMIANTTRNQYFEQLLNGMEMYAYTRSLPWGTKVDGALLVACNDSTICYEVSINYHPNHGINTTGRDDMDALANVPPPPADAARKSRKKVGAKGTKEGGKEQAETPCTAPKIRHSPILVSAAKHSITTSPALPPPKRMKEEETTETVKG